MKALKQIVAFECKYCKKVFKTVRHHCKYDPEKKNCFSCEHYTGTLDREPSEYHGTFGLTSCKIDGEVMCLDGLMRIGYYQLCKTHVWNKLPLRERLRGG